MLNLSTKLIIPHSFVHEFWEILRISMQNGPQFCWHTFAQCKIQMAYFSNMGSGIEVHLTRIKDNFENLKNGLLFGGLWFWGSITKYILLKWALGTASRVQYKGGVFFILFYFSKKPRFSLQNNKCLSYFAQAYFSGRLFSPLFYVVTSLSWRNVVIN